MNPSSARFYRGIVSLVFLISFSLAGACGSDPATAPVCTAGASVTCACPGGYPGAQTCNAAGSGYGVCHCDSPIDAGMNEDGGSAMDLGTPSDLGTPTDLGTAPDMGTVACDETALASGTSYFYVINLLAIAGPEGVAAPFTSVGYNLDGDSIVACNSHVVGETAEFSGQAPDFGSGIDNSLGGDLGGLANDSIQQGVDAGSTLLLVEVRGVDSLTNDSCVGVTIYPGALPVTTTAPEVDGAGHLAGGQYFDVLPATFTSTGRIISGRVQAGPSDLPVALPLLGADIVMPIRRAQVRFDLSASTISRGVIGGSINTAAMVAGVAAVPSLAMYADVVDSTFSSLADIDENGSPTSCEAGSIALKFDGVMTLGAP